MDLMLGHNLWMFLNIDLLMRAIRLRVVICLWMLIMQNLYFIIILKMDLSRYIRLSKERKRHLVYLNF